MVALVPVAHAEQGDAEDRALTEQMMKQADSPQTKPLQAQSDSAYGNSGNGISQSGQSVSKEPNNNGQ
ncbi:hypothetical protein FAZ95_12465 [Trinickia violacea]|uniref:Uncharacterized protein n=2 Tax=Trinickia violacea TaxID=2571746 RepID=A0A4P8IUA5_9BURK|nr:hypothetical protein FAZ95_12465 [Trinickia violacea]